MNVFENDELTDKELNQMLSTWNVTVPSEKMRARIARERQIIWSPSFVETSWYAGGQARSLGAALLAQLGAVALLFLIFTGPTVRGRLKKSVDAVILAPYRPQVSPAAERAAGGGGGGRRALTPVAKGAPPQFERNPFIPPMIVVAKPLLPVAPTISAAAPQIESAIYGDPLSRLNDGSAGRGSNGLGDGKGGGLGDGDGGGTGGGVFRAGGEVSSPVLVSKVEPEYSDQARKAKYSGTVLLSVVVDERGNPRDIRVVRALGLGLDEKAIEAVQHWRFLPGRRNGKAVRVQATIEVNFRLL